MPRFLNCLTRETRENRKTRETREKDLLAKFACSLQVKMAERTALFDIAELFDGVRELTDKARKKTERAMSQAAKLENGFRSYMPFRESTKTFRSYSMEYGKNFHSLLSRWFRGSKVKDVIFTSDLLD